MTPQQEKDELEFTSFTRTKGINQELQLNRKLGFIIPCVCSTPGISKSEVHLLHCECFILWRGDYHTINF